MTTSQLLHKRHMDAVWLSTTSSYQSDSKRFLATIEKCLHGEAHASDLLLRAECMRWRKKHTFLRVVGRPCEGESHELYSAQRVLVAKRLVQNYLWNQVYACLQPAPTTSVERVAMTQTAKRPRVVPTTRLPKVAK